jgi:hypothetical protein
MHLQGLNELVFLDLQQTEVTDAGLDHLSRLAKLEVLVLNGAPVSSTGIMRLNQARPSLLIYHRLNRHPPNRRVFLSLR